VIRKGARVERLTKKVGQVPETGRVSAIHDEYSIEVEWDVGHMSIISKDGVTIVAEANRPHKRD